MEGQWHHLVLLMSKGMLKNSTATLYIDGQLVSTVKVSILHQETQPFSKQLLREGDGMCMPADECACMSTCVRMWRPAVDFGCLPLLLTTLFLRQGPSRPRAHKMTRLVSTSTREPSSSTSLVPHTDAGHRAWVSLGCSCWCSRRPFEPSPQPSVLKERGCKLYQECYTLVFKSTGKEK